MILQAMRKQHSLLQRSPSPNQPVLSFFDITKLTRLSTDSSRQGLGFTLQQKTSDEWSLIQGGSRFLSDTESRYPTIKLELLAVSWLSLNDS